MHLSERLAWLAGLIDGEGCLSLVVARHKRGNSYMSSLTIVNTDVRMLHRAAAIGVEVGAKSHLYVRSHPYAPQRRSQKLVYSLRFDRQHMRQLLVAVMPHLVGKRDQAEMMLAYFLWRDGFNPSAKRDGSLAKEAEKIVRDYGSRLSLLKKGAQA